MPWLSFLLKNGVAQIALVVEDIDWTVENYHRIFGIALAFLHLQKPLLNHMTRNGKQADYEMRIAVANAETHG